MHDQSTAAPGGLLHGPTDRAMTIRAIVSAYTRPRVGVPTDGSGAPAVPVAPAQPGGDPLGAPAAPVAPPVPAPPAPPAPVPPAPVVPQFVAPVAPPAPAPVPPAPAPAPPGAQPPAPAAPPAPPAPADDRPLDQFPAEVRDYIASLRKEAGDNRVKAKTAEDKAAEQMKTWLDGIAKTFGLIQDAPDVPPEQQIAKLTEQLSGAQSDHRATQVELAIWRGAHQYGADPMRLADSRAFMKQVAGLDPSAAGFEQQLATAIGTAVAGTEHYKAAAAPPVPAGQAPPAPTPALPPVPSGGDFAGGTGAASTDPQTVDDFRAALKEARKAR